MPATVHHRLAPAPEQLRFPTTRWSARQRRSLPPPALTKRQSTLTQLDLVDVESSSSPFIHSTKRRRTTLPIPTHRVDDDSDFAEPQSSKPRHRTRAPASSQKSMPKQQKKRPSRFQSTMTQCWREEDTPPGQETLDQALLLSGKIGDCESETDSAVSSSPPTRLATHPALSLSAEHRGGSATTAAVGSSVPCTPQRNRKQVIPSSQTPSSIKLSTHSTRAAFIEYRSPLKERSTNASFFKQDQPYGPAKAALSKLTRPAYDNKPERVCPEETSQVPWISDLAFTPKRPVKHKDSALQRTATVQDSEDGDAEMCLPSRPLRLLNRTSTVQESPVDSDMAELDAPAGDLTDDPDEDLDNQCQHDAESTYRSLMQQATFDPVIAALDCDASRYGKSATQLQTQLQRCIHWQDSQEDYASMEAEVEDETVIAAADDTWTPADPHQAGAPSPERGERVEPLERVGEPDVIASSQPDERQLLGPNEEAVPSLIAPSTDQAMAERGWLMAPPPPLASAPHTAHPRRDPAESPPSQVSTVVPSQPHRPPSAPHTRPSQDADAAADTLTSSPFPLPPWSAGADSFARSHAETQGTLTDFGLPPPPHASSSAP